MNLEIADYALIGDGNTAALVGNNGSIDWLCWPRFDSDACFAALLGGNENGRWQIAPAGAWHSRSRRYLPDTLIVETIFETAEGAVRLTDFMPRGQIHSAIIRIVTGLRGSLDMTMEIALRHNYGAIAPWVEVTEDGFNAVAGPDRITLWTAAALQKNGPDVQARFKVTAGQTTSFILCYSPSLAPPSERPDAEAAQEGTAKYWRAWIAKFDKAVEWPDAVRRSLITLKALIHEPTGGIIAAPTLGLPEAPGGKLNWDYRYCWMRDATFTVAALLNAGFREEAEAWRNWALRAVAGQPDRLRIMYRVDGSRHIPAWEVSWLAGYQNAQPVRIGNEASTQHQEDVYGELIDALHLCAQAGVAPTPQSQSLQLDLLKYIERIWREPGAGLWEARGTPKQYVYSKVMAWVALDRFLQSKEGAESDQTDFAHRLTKLKQTMHDEICAKGFNSKLNSFVASYGSDTIDAGLLLLPLVKFLPIEDPRISGTVAAVEANLLEGGLVRRNKAEGDNPEGTFLPCSFWLADCRQMQGRHEAAREIVERVLSVRNDVGLLSEEYNVHEQRLAGNFPQALTHLALINSVLGISGSVTYQRGGG